MTKAKFLKLALIVLASVMLGVTGYVSWRWEKEIREITQAPPILLPLAPMIADEATGSELDISQWKTYRNEEYGFEIRYPIGWRERFQDDQYSQDTLIFALISPSLRRAQLTGNYWLDSVDISVNVLEISSFQVLDEIHERQISESGYNFILNKRRLMINNYDAYTMTIGGYGADLYIYFEKNSKLYNIIFVGDATLDALDLTNRKILSTFKFID